jgi:hypothetical protein
MFFAISIAIRQKALLVAIRSWNDARTADPITDLWFNCGGGHLVLTRPRAPIARHLDPVPYSFLTVPISSPSFPVRIEHGIQPPQDGGTACGGRGKESWAKKLPARRKQLHMHRVYCIADKLNGIGAEPPSATSLNDNSPMGLAQIAERGMESASVVNLVDEAGCYEVNKASRQSRAVESDAANL